MPELLESDTPSIGESPVKSYTVDQNGRPLEYVDGNGDVKYFDSQYGDRLDGLERKESDPTPQESSAEIAAQNAAEGVKIMEDVAKIERALGGEGGLNETIQNFNVLTLSSRLSENTKSMYGSFRQDFDRELGRIRSGILKDENMQQEIASLKKRVEAQTLTLKAELNKSRDAELAGREAVARHEASKTAAEAAKNIINNPRPEARPAQPATPANTTENEAPQRKISERERKLGLQYNKAADLMDQLLRSNRYKDPGDPRIEELKANIQKYKTLAQKQFEGTGRKPGLIGGMKEINRAVAALDDAWFAKQQEINPSGGKEAKKRLAKFQKSNNKYKRFL